jgi:aldehyde:ferredoxin oxidoreductase
MKRRLLIVDAGQQSWRLETLRVGTLAHDEREEYLTLHGEALCQYILRADSGRLDSGRRDPSALTVARGPMAFLAGNKATVGYLSPLTGVPHYSFVGGRAAAQLFNLGLDAIVLTGEAADDRYLVVSGRAPDLDVQFRPADEIPDGQRAAFYYLIESELSGRPETGSVFSLGEGTRHGYRAANLAVDGIYHAGRGGAGAVFARRTRAMVLRGEPLDQGRFFASLPDASTDPSFARSPNRAIADLLSPYTARLSDRTGGTIAKLYATGCIEHDERTLPARNATQIGYELAALGDKRVLAATRDGQTGCHWCPVDCRHWHWVPADYAPDGRDRFLDDFEPAYAIFAMLGLLPDDPSFQGQLAFLEQVNRHLFLPIEQLGCDVIDVGVGLAALFEGLERGLVPQEDVPAALRDAQLGDLEPAIAAVALLREGVDGAHYPALRAVGDGPQALADLYPEMADIVFTCGQGTLGNAGHNNALWTFLMPFSRFFGHYSGQIYKIDEALPGDPDDEALRRVFRRAVARMLDREFYGILCNALSNCAFTFVLYSQNGEGERLDDGDLLVHTLAQYGIRTTREDLMWFAQAFWAQSFDLKAQHGWQPPQAADLPRRVYEGLARVLGQPPKELERWMDMLIDEWKAQARGMLTRYGYDAAWLDG